MRTPSDPNLADRSMVAVKGGTAGITALLNLPIRMGITLANTHILGPAAYGLVHVGLMIAGVVQQMASLGSAGGIVRYTAKYEARGEKAKARFLIKRVALIMALVGLAAMFLLNMLADPIASWLEKDGLRIILPVLAALIPIGLIGGTAMAALRGMQHIRTKVILEDLVVPPVVLAALLIVLVKGWGLPGVLGVQLIGGALGTFLGWVWLKRWLGWTPVKAIKTAEFWRFSLPLAGTRLVAQTTKRLDIFLAAIFLPATQVGVYALATRLAPLVGLAGDRMNLAFGPRSVQILEEGRIEDVGYLMAASARWALLWAGLLALPFILAGPGIMRLFGRGFTGGAIALGILATGKLVSSACGPSGSLLTMSGHSGWTLATTLFFLFIQVSLAVTLIPRLGVRGAAIATASALVLTNLARLGLTHRLVRAHPFTPRLFALVVLFCCLALGGKLAEGNGLPVLATTAVVGVVWLGFGLVAGLTASEREDVMAWIGKLWRKNS